MSTLGIENIEHTNGTTAMTVDNAGRVFQPQKPAFSVRGYGSSFHVITVNGVTLHANAQIINNWQSVEINRGNAFNAATGVYTVPVAGLYQLHAGFGYKSSSNYMKIMIYATSSDEDNHGFISTWANNDNNHTGRQLSTIVEASVGQEFAMGMSDNYSNPHTTTAYLWFSGYLIG